MQFLITGITGQVGYDIKLELEKRGYTDILAPSSKEMDIKNKEQVQNTILTYKPNIIFHCVAYTAVDKAETEKDICFNININGTKYIAKCADQIGSPTYSNLISIKKEKHLTRILSILSINRKRFTLDK